MVELAGREVPHGGGPSSDVAEAAVYLASDGARYMVRECILVDGGLPLSPRPTV